MGQRSARRRPLGEQGEGLLFALARTEAEGPVKREPAEDVDTAPARRADPRRVEQSNHGIARQAPPAFQRGHEQFTAAGKGCGIQPELPVTPCQPRDHARRQQLAQPSHVRRRGEMQGAAQQPCADNLLRGNRRLDIFLGRIGRPEPDRPEGGEIVLGLDGAKPGHCLARLPKGFTADALVAEALMGDG